MKLKKATIAGTGGLFSRITQGRFIQTGRKPKKEQPVPVLQNAGYVPEDRPPGSLAHPTQKRHRRNILCVLVYISF